MAVKIAREKWTGKIGEMIIGTGQNKVKIGGENTLPFLHFEGEMPNRPALALEVWDMEPENWPELLKEAYQGVLKDPVAWAKKNVEYGADLILLRLASAHPDNLDISADKCAQTALAVAEAIDIPLIVIGCDIEEKDAEIMPAVGEALAGRNCLIGLATENNYKTLVATCLVNGHNVIASSPLDINLAKQLNILISEMNLGTNNIAIDPLVGPLGYGIEYAYSIMERTRLGALMGDKMLSMPIICFVGVEAWKTKEAKSPYEDNPQWGDLKKRAILWEVVTTVTLAQAGGALFVLCHPESLQHLNNHFNQMMTAESY